MNPPRRQPPAATLRAVMQDLFKTAGSAPLSHPLIHFKFESHTGCILTLSLVLVPKFIPVAVTASFVQRTKVTQACF